MRAAGGNCKQMTFINWSDAEEMLGLLVEYVSDERSNSTGDRARSKFLGDLSRQLEVAADDVTSRSADATIDTLRAILESQPGEFERDEVLVHVQACIEELERIRRQK